MSLDQLIEQEPKSRPGIVFSIPDYFPSDADELELYRSRLLAAIPLAQLAELHDDPRGVFVFDPMVVEEHGAENYDEVIAACEEYGGLWFDPSRPADEQDLPFEEHETIDLSESLLDSLTPKRKKSASTAKTKKAKKSKSANRSTKKSAKKSKPANRSTKKSKSANRSTKKSAKKSKSVTKGTKKSRRRART